MQLVQVLFLKIKYTFACYFLSSMQTFILAQPEKVGGFLTPSSPQNSAGDLTVSPVLVPSAGLRKRQSCRLLG